MKNFILLFSFFAFNNTMLFPQTQGEMNFQASNSYTKVDKELGVVYQQILKKYSKNTKFINLNYLSQQLACF
jgi:uncharacterized protein YecT (DUF1311 family)